MQLKVYSSQNESMLSHMIAWVLCIIYQKVVIKVENINQEKLYSFDVAGWKYYWNVQLLFKHIFFDMAILSLEN